MTDKLTDAQLIERLRLRAKHGAAGAAEILGIVGSAERNAISLAKKRGLKATDKQPDELATAKAKLKVAERELEKIVKDNLSAAEIRRTIYGLSPRPPAPPKWISLPVKRLKDSRVSVPVAFWSDWHWGEVVFKEQVGGVNEFNRAIAIQRLKRLVNTTIELARHNMADLQYPGIVIVLGGDMISGNIHEELRETNDGPVQVTLLELQDHLVGALTRMADEFGQVFVPCVVGNHGRMKMKPHAKNKVYESYEWNLYHQLERHFRDDNRLRFLIPGETDAAFEVLGHRFHLTHGDAIGVKGGDGIIGAIGPIVRGTVKIGRSEAQIGRDFDTLMMGHWHTYVPRGDASPVLVNGTLKGYDEYARLFLRVPYSRPSQALFFVHGTHGITAQWQVFLDDKRVSADSSDWVRFEQRRVA